MKKIVYMLSLAIGLSLAGCASWDEFEPLPADTWGPEPELTVTTDSVLTTDTLHVGIVTKNAQYVALYVNTAAEDVDYTTLLQEGYSGAQRFETDLEGDTLNLRMPGVVAGNTYYVYVVAANENGVQATFNTAVGAIDVTAPQVLNPTSRLYPTNQGRSATVTFTENIVREQGAGAVTFEVLDLDLNQLFAGEITDIEVSGAQMRVTLPESVVWVTGQSYIVLLSFAQGAVSDESGNPMEALVNSIDDSYIPHGPWWLYDATGGDTPVLEGFFQEQEYTFYMSFDGGNGAQDAGTTANFIADGTYDISGWGNDYSGIVANQWSINGFLSGTLQGFTASDFPAYSYELAIQGETYEWMTIMLPDAGGPVTIGTHSSYGDVYLVDFVQTESSMYINVEFAVVTDTQSGMEFAATMSTCPALAVYYNGGYGIIATLADMQFWPSSANAAAPAKIGAIKATVVPMDHIVPVQLAGVKAAR